MIKIPYLFGISAQFLILTGCHYRLPAHKPSAWCPSSQTPYAGGNGTPTNPYMICNPIQFEAMQNNLSAHYRLGANLDFSNISFSSIGSASVPFTGTLDKAGFQMIIPDHPHPAPIHR